MLKIKEIFCRPAGTMIVFEMTQMVDGDDYPYIWIPSGMRITLTKKDGKTIEVKEEIK